MFANVSSDYVNRGEAASATEPSRTSTLLDNGSRLRNVTMTPPWTATHLTKKDTKARKALTIALCCCFFFMLLEFIGGYISHSLALTNDAAHMLTDVCSLGISLLAIVTSSKATNPSFSYGWGRVEVIGAMGSLFMTWGLVIFILIEAVSRIVIIIKCYNGYNNNNNNIGSVCEGIDAKLMAIIGAVGLCSNILCGVVLLWGGHHGHSHGGYSSGCGGHSHSDSAEEEIPRECHHNNNNSNDDPRVHRSTHNNSHTSNNHSNVNNNHRNSSIPNNIQYYDPATDSPATMDSQEAEECRRLISGTEHNNNNNNNNNCCASLHNNCTPIYAGDHSHSHDHTNMNIRGAALHVCGDIMQSVAVIISSLVIYICNNHIYGNPIVPNSLWNLADPVCSIVFALMTVMVTRDLAADVFYILMQATPRSVDVNSIRREVELLSSVHEVTELHVWGLSPGHCILVCHVIVHIPPPVVSDNNNNNNNNNDNSNNNGDITTEVLPYRVTCDNDNNIINNNNNINNNDNIKRVYDSVVMDIRLLAKRFKVSYATVEVATV